ncbi:hypothetical protein GCM10009740_30140 [Terrabacter terrae]|uniref:Uncharacterized protein n=1 Tax=Terrabacter terrae TaxID=318434 RepID=A0ABP5FYD9_9MICO
MPHSEQRALCGPVPALLVALPLAALLGAVIGVAWVVGYTLLGLTVEDRVVRGRRAGDVGTRLAARGGR